MKFGTNYSFWGNEWRCNYIEVAKKVAQIGFDVLEIGADHLYNMSEAEMNDISNTAKSLGLTLTTNSGPSREYDLASENASVRAAGLAYFQKILKNMKRIESPTLVGAIYSFWPSDFVYTNKKAAWDHSISGLKELSKTAEDLGIECALEVLNRNETYILNDCKEAMEYCDRIGSPNMKILLDTYHMNIEEDNMIDALLLAGNRLGHVHVGECNRKLPGMNNSLPWAKIGEALRKIHYEKAVVMEPFLLSGGAVGHDIRVWRDLSDNADAATMDKLLTDSLKFLKTNFIGE